MIDFVVRSEFSIQRPYPSILDAFPTVAKAFKPRKNRHYQKSLRNR